MSPASRTALIALALVILLGPLVTLHPVVTRFYEAGLANLSIETSHPQVILVLALTVLSALPTAGFLLSLATAARSHDGMQALFPASKPVTCEDLHYRVIPSEAVFLFTTGLFRPVVFVSSEATRTLSTAELHAALLHECAHQRNRDVLWGLLLRTVDRGFGFLPPINRLAQTATLRAECEADEYALRRGARRSDLFEAIAAASSAPASLPSAGIADANVEFRLSRLIRPETPIPGPPTRGFLALAAATALPAVLAHAIAIVAAVCATKLV